MIVNIEIAPGELIDKITILEIKLARITAPAQRENVAREYALLSLALEVVPPSPELARLQGALKTVNETLWGIEDDIREHERRQDFGAEFINLARAVYRTNDERARVKRAINDLLNSNLIEEKAYADY